MAKKRKLKKTNEPQKYTSVGNFFLNILIFVLSVIIIYMSYSLFIKLSGNKKEVPVQTNYEKPAEIIQAEVLNGCGVSGLAERCTDYLRENGVDVVGMGNYTSFDIDESIVIDRIGNKSNALKIAKILGINKKNVIQQLSDEYFLDVSVIIGRDFDKLKPIK